jgi:hypothetical protein
LMTIADGCRSGKLISAYRPLNGGTVTIIPDDWWETETHQIYARFVTCTFCPDDPFGTSRMSPDDPFGIQDIPDSKRCWIFIERKSLDRYIHTQPFAPIDASANCHLSTYLLAKRWMHAPNI